MPSYSVALPYLPFLTVAMLTLGMASIFFWADRSTPSTRSLALWLACLGLSMLIVAPQKLGMFGLDMSEWELLHILIESVGLLAGMEWLQRVRRTAALAEGRRNWGAWLLWLAQACVVWHLVIQIIYNGSDLGAPNFAALWDADVAFNWKAFWIRGMPIYTAMNLAAVSILLMLFWRLDKTEWTRLAATAAAAPFLISGLILDDSYNHWVPFVTLVGELIFFGGMIGYLIAQGQRAQFMSRFLSPQVAQMVRKKGLRQALQPQQLSVSVVSCDLRGFTAYAHKHDSARVLEIMHHYYRRVGEIATQYGGTVKDHAGDGILILVGAPLPLKDHVSRALDMSLRIRDAGRALMAELQVPELGIGVGVASGVVTVGAIGGASRLEYAAVGTAVNLASRLCDQAEAGEVLIAGSIGSTQLPRHMMLLQRDALDLKGFPDPVSVYALETENGEETVSAVRTRAVES